MNHSELQEKLFDWHDGQLSVEQANEVRNHFAACAECRAQLEAWKLTAQNFLVPLEIKETPLFTQNVMREIRSSQAAKVQARPRFFARWAFPALALSAGSFAAIALYVSQPTAISTDGLFLSDQQATSSEWIANVANDDQILASVVEKP